MRCRSPSSAAACRRPRPGPYRPRRRNRGRRGVRRAARRPGAGFAAEPGQLPPVTTLPDDIPRDEAYFTAFRAYVAEKNGFPDSRQFGRYLLDFYGVTGRDGGPLSEGYLRGFVRDFRLRLRWRWRPSTSP